jgi:diguanylate cyclase (GGDEF)-like protein
VLKAIADIVSDNIRAADSLGRWGGEEFMVLVPETDLQEAAYFAEKLRGLISGYLFEKVGKVTASFGVSRYIMGNSMDGLIKSTDDMLYFAKNSGRDQVKAMSENNGSTLST